MILLTAINSKYIHSNLAVYSLKAASGDYSDIVDIAEYTINMQADNILMDIYQRNPSVLCFSCYIWNISYVEKIACSFHKICPDIPIWLGGPEVSFYTEEYLKAHPYIRGIMIGEGEETFRELCAFYYKRISESLNGSGEQDCSKSSDFAEKPDYFGDCDVYGTEKPYALKDIRSISFRAEDNEMITTDLRFPTNIDLIPFYYTDEDQFTNRIIYYESSRGCPFSCSYCLSSIDKKLRFKNPDLVKKELSFFIKNKVKQVKFIDRTFNCNHSHAVAIWSFIKENDNGITNFHFEISADLLNEEEIKLLTSMRPGLIQLEIGVQSTNERTIKAINRTMDIPRLKEAVLRMRNSGNIHQHLDLIAGLPFEDYESFKNSFDEIINLWPSNLQLGFLKVLKGSYIHSAANEYGIVYKDSPPYEVLFTKWLDYSDMIKIKTVEEMLEVYYNSGQFEVTMKLIDVMAESLYDFFLELGCHYKKNGLDNISHTRIRRCEILLDYLKGRELSWVKASFDEPDIELIKEALTYDLYYREKCKTRPAWAGDFDYREYRNRIDPFFDTNKNKGSMTHMEAFHYHFPGSGEYNLISLPQRLEEPLFVLFDYDDRDPLTHQANVSII